MQKFRRVDNFLIYVIIKAQVRDTTPNNQNKGRDLPPNAKAKRKEKL